MPVTPPASDASSQRHPRSTPSPCTVIAQPPVPSPSSSSSHAFHPTTTATTTTSRAVLPGSTQAPYVSHASSSPQLRSSSASSHAANGSLRSLVTSPPPFGAPTRAVVPSSASSTATLVTGGTRSLPTTPIAGARPSGDPRHGLLTSQPPPSPTARTPPEPQPPRPLTGTADRPSGRSGPRRRLTTTAANPVVPTTANPGVTASSSADAATALPVHALIHDLYRSVLTERPSQPLPFIVSRLHSAGPPNTHRFLDLNASGTDSGLVVASRPQPVPTCTSAAPTHAARHGPVPVVVEVTAPEGCTDLGQLSPPTTSAGRSAAPASARSDQRESVPQKGSRKSASVRALELTSLRELHDDSEAPTQEVEEVVASPPALRPNCPTAAPSPQLAPTTGGPISPHAQPSSAAGPTSMSPAQPLPVSSSASRDQPVQTVAPPPPPPPPTRPPLYPQSAPRPGAPAALSSRVLRGRAPLPSHPPDVDAGPAKLSSSPPTTLVIPHAMPPYRPARSQRNSGSSSDADGNSVDGVGWCSPGLPSRQTSECSLDLLSGPVPGPSTSGRAVTSARGISTGAPTAWTLRPSFSLNVNHGQGPGSATSSRLSTPCATASLMSTFGNYGGNAPPMFTLGGLMVGGGAIGMSSGPGLSSVSSGMGVSHASTTVNVPGAPTPGLGSSVENSMVSSSARGVGGSSSVPAVELTAFVKELRQVKEETVGHEAQLVTFDALCDVLERAAVAATDVQLLAALFDELLRPILLDVPSAPMNVAATTSHNSAMACHGSATTHTDLAAGAPPTPLPPPPPPPFTVIATTAECSPPLNAALSPALGFSRSSTILLSTMPSITNTAIMPCDTSGGGASVDTSAAGESAWYHHATASSSATPHTPLPACSLSGSTTTRAPLSAAAAGATPAALSSVASDVQVSSINSSTSQPEYEEEQAEDTVSAITGVADDEKELEEEGEPMVMFDAYVARMAYMIAGQFPRELIHRAFLDLVLLTPDAADGDDAPDRSGGSAYPSARVNLATSHSNANVPMYSSSSPLLALPLRDASAHGTRFPSPASSTQSLFVLNRVTSLPSSPSAVGLSYDGNGMAAAGGAAADLMATTTSTLTLGAGGSSALTITLPLSVCVVEGCQKRLGIRGLTVALVSQVVLGLGLAPPSQRTASVSSSSRRGAGGGTAAAATPGADSESLPAQWWDMRLTLADFDALASQLAMITESLWRADLASRQGTPRLRSVSDSFGDGDDVGEDVSVASRGRRAQSGGGSGAVTALYAVKKSAADETGIAAANTSTASLTDSVGSNKGGSGGGVHTVTVGAPGQSAAAVVSRSPRHCE